MSAAPAAGSRLGRVRRWTPLILIAVGVIVIGWQLPRGDSDIPLDPWSAAPSGTKGVVDVLDELASAEVGTDTADADTALLLRDRLGEPARADLLRWVQRGGLLVVTDPRSTLTDVEPTSQTTTQFLDTPLDRGCDEPALRGAERVQVTDPVMFTVPEDARGCFRAGGGAWLVLQPLGEGTVARLGGAEALTNEWLDDADNAVAAAALLAPTPDTQVMVLDPEADTEIGGQRTLGDLIHPRVVSALVQLGVAFLFLAAWRGRRLGRPVAEPQPVSLPASELVVAVGNLLQRSRNRDHAAKLLAADLRRTLCERLGLPPSMRDADVAAAAAARTGVERDRILTALTPRQVNREADLVTLANTVESIRHEVLKSR